MKLHAITFLAGVFLTHSAGGKPQDSQSLVARGANVYGAGGGFNPGPFPVVPQEQPRPPAFRRERLEQPLVQQLQQPEPVPAGPAPAPAPENLPRQVLNDGPSGPSSPPYQQPTPLEEIDLRVTDLTTGGRQPPIGSNDIGSGPSAALQPLTPLVVGSTGQNGISEPRRPSLDNVFNGVPPLASPNGGELGAGVINRYPEAVVGFERNSAQAGGEAEAVPLSVSPSYGNGGDQPQPAAGQQGLVVARGGDTYGAGQSVEVPRPPVSGDLDIRPPEPRTKERNLSQAAVPDTEDEPPSQPTAGLRSVPPPEDNGEGHHMGGIEWLPESIPGEPLVDYPVLVRIPDSGFDCANQEYDGFFADTSEEARCQAFWVCHNKQQDGFLCPNGTMFNQRYFTCDWWFNVRCEESPDYYELNKNIGVVGTRIDTLPAGVVAAESKVHPVFTLLSEMLRYPRVPPVPPHKLNKTPARLSPVTKPAADFRSSVEIMEKIQDRQTAKVHPVGPKTSKRTKSTTPWPGGMPSHVNVKSRKRAVNERSADATSRVRGARAGRRQRHRKRSRRHRARSAAAPSNSSAPQAGKNPSSQAGTPEPYIETIQKIDLPMTASGTPKLVDAVTVMEKEGNVTLSQSEKQIPLNLSASKAGAAKPTAAGAADQPKPAPPNQTSLGPAPQEHLNQSGQPTPPPQPTPAPAQGQTPQAQGQAQPAGVSPGQVPQSQIPSPPAVPTQGQPPVRSSQEGVPNPLSAGTLPVAPQGQPTALPTQGQSPIMPPQQPSGLTSEHGPVQPQDQPPPPPGSSQPAAAPGQLTIDEDVKVEDGDASAPVEKKLHFPPDPGTAQSEGQNQPPAGSNSTNGTDQNGISIDEDIKVDEGDPDHPVEEELRYPPGGKPTLVGGPAHRASSHSGGATASPNTTLNNPANLRDPSALHHDMPSENAPLDEAPKAKSPPSDSGGKSQVGDEIKITSETVSKVVQNPKAEAIRDPSGLGPPKSDKPQGSAGKKSSDQKRESDHSKNLVKDIPRDVNEVGTEVEKRYPEVRIIGNLQPLHKSGLSSKVTKTVNTVDEKVHLQPQHSGQSKTYDAGTFYLSPPDKNRANGVKSQTSLSNPIGINLKILVNQKPINAANQSATTFISTGQTSTSLKNRRMIKPEVPFVADAYDYDFSELPSWMQRAAAVKRNADFFSSAEMSVHEQVDGAIAAEVGQNMASLPRVSRPVRKAVHASESQSYDLKRVLTAPRVRKVFQSAREELMKLLGGPQESLDSEIDTLLGKREYDKDKRENDMKLRLDSSSLTSYPEQGLDPL